MSQFTEMNAEIVRRGFAPIVQRHGLREPTIRVSNMFFDLIYRGPIIGLHIIVEYDYFFVFAAVFRVPDDTVPDMLPGLNGQVCEVYLQQALDKLGISYEIEAVRLKELGGQAANCSTMVAVLASLLERAWPAIETKASELFPGCGSMGSREN